MHGSCRLTPHTVDRRAKVDCIMHGPGRLRSHKLGVESWFLASVERARKRTDIHACPIYELPGNCYLYCKILFADHTPHVREQIR